MSELSQGTEALIGATSDAQHQMNLLQFQAEQAALQTKALQAIEHDTRIIQAILSVWAVLTVIGVIVLVALNLSAS
jgi:hypothetical protein